MTGVSADDPRLEPIAQFLADQYGPAFSGYRLVARRLLAVANYADEAAGIQRVEIAVIQDWMRQLDERRPARPADVPERDGDPPKTWKTPRRQQRVDDEPV